MSARRHLIAAVAKSRGTVPAVADVARAEQLVDAHHAEVLTADGQAYTGELAMLRGLLATLHAVAAHGAVPDVPKLLAEPQADAAAARAHHQTRKDVRP